MLFKLTKNKKSMTKKQIQTKLTKLNELLENIQEAQIIDPHDSDTWDPDTLYNLTEQLKDTLKLLEDHKFSKKNEFGENLVSVEMGLCSLIDEYQEEEEND